MPRHLLTSVDGSTENFAMLFRYTATLAASAGMTLCTCLAVFKWENVKRDAGHGTMFMVFFCWFFWSFATLYRTFLVFGKNGLDTLEDVHIRRMTFITETFFNAISLWFILAAYEFQRRALSPRSPRSHHTCLITYMLVVGGLSLALLLTLVIIDHGGQTVTGLDAKDPTEAEPYSAVVLTHLSWATWCIRCIAVGYPAVVALWLDLRRDMLPVAGLPKALSLTVLFFFVLNTPYLVIDPLFVFGVLDVDVHNRVLGLMKTFSYLSGVAISVVMGLSIRGFDAFYHANDPRRSSGLSRAVEPHDSLFVFSDGSTGSDRALEPESFP
ncbi:Aste57867_3021 [Aphanomyces stellatus]|uniref:Aste57867_3021 protein n=1 Tax=Aphanomyces stellatus TaxID=120398 RepID=A0A485KCL4_9STRA|nr:hypothetical protein As57867_003012 [Aphanomyces stellatus]VFT80201.1 Aste57867_3021 [Aphanomyces stellatus]